MAVSTLGRDYDISRILADHERRISFLERRLLLLGFLVTPGVVYDTGWLDTGIAFGGSWQSFAASGATNVVEYRRIGHEVKIRGLVRRITSALNGTVGGTSQSMLALPAGFRPTRREVFTVASNAQLETGLASAGTAHTHPIMNSTATGPACQVEVTTAGQCIVTLPAGMSLQVNDWVSLAGISFYNN